MPLDPDDPLLPMPDPTGWIPPLEDDTDDAWAQGNAGVRDYYMAHTIVLPAFDAVGAPTRPPDEHVLDHLARAHDLADQDAILLRPEAGTVVVGSRPHSCDICGDPEVRYDGVLETGAGPQRGFACVTCFRSRRREARPQQHHLPAAVA